MPSGAHAADNAARALLGHAERSFDWRHPGLCTSIGRRDGIIQLVRADGSPAGRRVTGRAGAWIKEMVCRYVIAALAWERRGIAYRWLRTGRAPGPALLEAPR
jgi:NADH dehydrogenase FAD-containing subunit